MVYGSAGILFNHLNSAEWAVMTGCFTAPRLLNLLAPAAEPTVERCSVCHCANAARLSAVFGQANAGAGAALMRHIARGATVCRLCRPFDFGCDDECRRPYVVENGVRPAAAIAALNRHPSSSGDMVAHQQRVLVHQARVSA